MILCLAGSEGDIASSSEGDDISRLVLTSGHMSGHCSPFSRRQFPRDSGCYDAHKNSTRRNKSPEILAKPSRENNLDSSSQSKCTTDASALSESKEDYHPNIPAPNSGHKDPQFDKSPALRTGNVRYIAKRGSYGETVVIENACDDGHKLIKYVVGSGRDLGLETVSASQKGCFSEKSSDSGFSSSSISSAPLSRDKTLSSTIASDSPTKSFANFTRNSPTSHNITKNHTKTDSPLQ